jgi:hypothetical protein
VSLPQLTNVREERRFLLLDVEAVRQLLKQRGDLGSYRVRTLYVDTAEGTWSKDPTKPRFRLRVYNGEDSFLEVKLRIPGTRCYVKRRRKADGVPDGMVTLGQSRYTRQEWESGTTRVTIDQQVSTQNRTLQGFVVETKLPVGDPLPNWLRLLKPYERNFSKWRWVSG